MLEEMRKRSIKSFIPKAVILIIVGIGALIFFNQQIIGSFKSKIEFYEIENADELKYRYADITVDFSFGCYAEYYTEDSATKKKSIQDLHYVIVTSDGILMGIKVPKSYENDMGKIVDQSLDYFFNGNDEFTKTLSLSGYISKMESEDNKYFREFIVELGEYLGITSDEIDEYSIPFVLTAGNDMRFLYIIIAVAALFFILFAIFRLIYIFTGGSQKALIKYIKSFDGDLYKAESDYGSALHMFPTIKIGRLYIFYGKGSKTGAIKNSEIVWAYHKTTTHRTNGIKTGTTYEVITYTKDKKMISLTMKTEDDSIKLLDYINQNMPNVVIGYTDDLLNLFRKNYPEFLNIAYSRKVEESTDPYTDSYSQEPVAGDDLYTDLYSQEPLVNDEPFASDLNKPNDDDMQ